MKAAVIYYSLEGNTKYAAQKIAQKLGADLLELMPVKAYPTGKASKYIVGGKAVLVKERPKLREYVFVPEKYDLVVLGTPVWAGSFAPPLRTFVSEQNLSQKAVGLFTCSASGNGQKCMQKLMEALGISSMKAELNLVNPAKEQTQGDNEKIEAFCDQLVSNG